MYRQWMPCPFNRKNLGQKVGQTFEILNSGARAEVKVLVSTQGTKHDLRYCIVYTYIKATSADGVKTVSSTPLREYMQVSCFR